LVGLLVGCKLDTIADGRSSDIMSLKKCELVTFIYLRNYSEFDLKKFHCNFFFKLPLLLMKSFTFKSEIIC